MVLLLYSTVIIHYIHNKYSGTIIVFWTFIIVAPWYFWKYFGIPTKHHSKLQRLVLSCPKGMVFPLYMSKKKTINVKKNMVLFCNDHYSLVVCEQNYLHIHVSWYYYCNNTLYKHKIHYLFFGHLP